MRVKRARPTRRNSENGRRRSYSHQPRWAWTATATARRWRSRRLPSDGIRNPDHRARPDHNSEYRAYRLRSQRTGRRDNPPLSRTAPPSAQLRAHRVRAHPLHPHRNSRLDSPPAGRSPCTSSPRPAWRRSPRRDSPRSSDKTTRYLRGYHERSVPVHRFGNGTHRHKPHLNRNPDCNTQPPLPARNRYPIGSHRQPRTARPNPEGL